MLTLGFLTFTLFGVVLVLVGASFESMADALELTLDQLAVLGASLQLGLGAGVVIAGPLVDRLPRKPLLCAACALAAAALASVESEMSFARAVFHVVAVGFGGGLCETTINTLTVQRFRERAIRPLTLIHTAANVGAIGGPLIIGLLIAGGDWTAGFRATGIGWALAGIGWLFVRLPHPVASGARPARQASILTPGLFALSAVAFAYVGMESGLTLMAVPYATDALGLDASRGRSAISAFWFGLLLGRLGIVALTARADIRYLIGGGIAAGLLLATGVALGFTQVELLVGATGICVGFVFPLMVSLAGEWFPHSAGTATGLVIGAGCLGGFLVPWLSAAIAQSESVALGFGSFALWALCISAAAEAARRSRLQQASDPR